MEKSNKANPLVRNLANINPNKNVVWRASKSGDVESSKKASDREIMELRATIYDVLIDNDKVHEVQLRHGGVYSMLLGISANGTTISKIIEVIEPNSMNILWLIPQYVIMTLGEVMFSVTGLEFSYSQAPVTMKSVIQACWLLTVAFGNVIVVIVAESKFFQSQAYEFFLFSGLMFVDMIIFMWVAYRYKPNDPNISESRQNLIDNNEPDSSIGSIERQRELIFGSNYRQSPSVAPNTATTSRVPRYTKRQQLD